MMILLLSILIQSCNVTSPYVTGAKIDMQKNDYVNAEDKLLKAVDNNAKDVEALYLLGKISSKKGDFEKMVDYFNRATLAGADQEKVKDMDLEKQNIWATLYTESGVMFKAGQKKINEQDEEGSIKDFEKAIKKLELSLVLIDNSKESLLLLAYCYYYTKNMDKALEAAEKLLVVDAENMDAIKISAIITWDNKDFEKAVKYYGIIYNKDPQNKEAVSRLADYYAKQNKIDDAIGMYDAILAIEPDNTDILFNKADMLYKKKNDVQGAIATLEKLVSVNSEDLEAIIQLGNLYYNQKDFQKVVDLLEPNAEFFTADNKKPAFDLLFYSYGELGNTAKAKKYYIE